MNEDERIHDFHMIVLEIANDSEDLGEKISKNKLIKKMFRYLPKRFDMKVTSIEEAQDINNIKVDDLMASLQNLS